jgi:hypothetical protein
MVRKRTLNELLKLGMRKPFLSVCVETEVIRGADLRRSEAAGRSARIRFFQYLLAVSHAT